MAFEEKHGKSVLDQSRKQKSAAPTVIGDGGFDLPNSMMSEFAGMGDSGSNSSNAVIYREMLPLQNLRYASAESEADRLSAGVRGTKPEEIRREMGQRLNADLSEVRFHSDLSSQSRAEKMGARAWTRGNDVYFGKGGFDPVVAAHELVHTVQQGAAKGSVSEHAPAGSVQMWSLFGWNPFKKKAPAQNAAPDTHLYPADKADLLYKLEGGIAAKQSEISADKAKNLNAEFTKQKKKDADENQAYKIASRKNRNYRGKNHKDVLTQEESSEFNQQLQNMTYEDYAEIMDRMDDAAVKMVDYREKIEGPEHVGALALKAATHTSGMDYQIYGKIIKTLKSMYPEKVAEWEKQRASTQKKDKKRAAKIRQASRVVSMAYDPKKNSYLKTGEGIKDLANARSSEAAYYKKVHAGTARSKVDIVAEDYRKRFVEKRKKTSIDIDAEIRDDSSEDGDFGNLIDIPGRNNRSLKSGRGNIIENDDSLSEDDNLIKNDSSPIIKLKDDPDSSLLGGGMKEKDESFDDGASLVDNLNKSYAIGGDDSILDDDKIEEDDENNIIRQRGVVDENLLEPFTAGNKKIGSMKKFSGVVGLGKNVGALANFSAQLSLLNHNLQDGEAFKTIYGPAFGGVANGLGAVSGGMGVITGAYDIWRNAKNVKAGGRKLDVATAALDTVTSATAMVSGGLGVMQKMAGIPLIGDTLNTIGSFGGPNLIPGLNIATGAGTAIAGGVQAFRGQRAINKIDDQIDALTGKGKKKKKKLTKDQERLLKIFKQGRRISEFNRTSGTLKTLSGGLTLGTGAAMLAGPLAPIAAAGLGIASLATGIGKFIYDKVKKKNLRKDITAEEMNINWDNEIKLVKNAYKSFNLSTKEARAVILKGHGYEEGTRTAAMKTINMNRAKYLIDTVHDQGRDAEKARKVISSLGVHRGKDGRYAAGALKLLAEKLG